MTDSTARQSRFTIVVSELLIVVWIVTTLWAFLLPAVNATREARGKPILLSVLHPLYATNPWPFVIAAPAATTFLLAILLALLRQLLPRPARRFIIWRSPPRPSRPPVEPIHDGRPAAYTIVMAVTASAVLIFAGSHVRSDRTHRRPVITWEGFAAEYVQYLALFGWTLSAVALVYGIYTLLHYRSRINVLAAVGAALGGLNFFGSCLFFGALYED